MSELYNKVYNLFNQWLSTEEEDEEEFKEWLNNQFVMRNGKVYIQEVPKLNTHFDIEDEQYYETHSEGMIIIALVDEDNNRLPNKPCSFNFVEDIIDLTTDSNGYIQLWGSQGTWRIYEFTISFDGDNEYNPCEAHRTYY